MCTFRMQIYISVTHSAAQKTDCTPPPVKGARAGKVPAAWSGLLQQVRNQSSRWKRGWEKVQQTSWVLDEYVPLPGTRPGVAPGLRSVRVVRDFSAPGPILASRVGTRAHIASHTATSLGKLAQRRTVVPSPRSTS
ncbi:peptidase M16 family protein [Anopheles sinensis]|uniref:Peptidase M16 family protein n=1 Tax=Anopheles sinensis TaxID=74873 RepID=A0A084VVC3_ANOSI|nr:peptidase M16 family protein [Anopheles sinensis]